MSDDGFGLVEIAVSMGVGAMLLAVTSLVIAASLNSVSESRRRTVANAYAEETMELARSLDFDEVGLSATDSTLGSDTALTYVAGVYKRLVNGVQEPVVFATTGSGHPFNPHIKSVLQGSVNLTRSVWVTGADTNSDGTVDVRRVTTKVAWSSVDTTKAITLTTLIHPEGVAVTGLSPAGAACPPGATNCVSGLTPMYTQATTSAGTVNVRSGLGNVTGLIPGVLPADSVDMILPRASVTGLRRGVTTLGCSATGTRLTAPGLNYSSGSSSSSADDDPSPAGPAPAEVAVTGTGLPATPVSDGSVVDNLILQSLISSPTSCITDTSNTGSDVSPAPDDGLPWAKAEATGPAALTARTAVGAALPAAGNIIDLFNIATPVARAELDHRLVGTQRMVDNKSEFTFADMTVAKVPVLVPDGLVRVTALTGTAKVTSAELASDTAPSLTTPGGFSVKVYDPAAALTGCTRAAPYCTFTVNALTGMTANVSGSFLANAGLTTVTFTTSVRVNPPAIINSSVDPVTGAVRSSVTSATLEIHTTMNVNVQVALVNLRLLETAVDVNIGNLDVSGCSGVGCG